MCHKCMVKLFLDCSKLSKKILHYYLAILTHDEIYGVITRIEQVIIIIICVPVGHNDESFPPFVQNPLTREIQSEDLLFCGAKH